MSDKMREWVEENVPEEDMPADDIILFFEKHAERVVTGVSGEFVWVMLTIDFETTINWNDRDGFEFPDEVLYSLWKLMGEQRESTTVQ